MATIAAKLAATEREADAARVRAKLKAARMKSAGDTKLMPPPAKKEGSEEEPVKGDRRDRDREGAEGDDEQGITSRKRKAGARQGGRASRRRSTLNPWELESLILGGVSSAGD